jgi:hypothetical protein
MNLITILLVIGVVFISLLMGAIAYASTSDEYESPWSGWEDRSDGDTNPFTFEKYVDVDCTVKTKTNVFGITEGIKISNVDHKLIEKRTDLDFLGLLWEKGNLKVELMMGNRVIEEKQKDVKLPSAKDAHATYGFLLGPLPEDATEYTIHVDLYFDGKKVDSYSKTKAIE